MSDHVNIGWSIYEEIESTLNASIKNLTIRSVYRFPEGEDIAGHLGKYGRSALFRLASVESRVEVGSGVDSYSESDYSFECVVYKKTKDTDQQLILDLVEQVKYYLHQSKHNTPHWKNLRVEDVEYNQTEISNVKQALLRIRILRDG